MRMLLGLVSICAGENSEKPVFACAKLECVRQTFPSFVIFEESNSALSYEMFNESMLIFSHCRGNFFFSHFKE